MQAWADDARRRSWRIGFVPTMGALHEGHLSLVREARRRADMVVASIFVNPLQFGPAEDFSVYPRDFERDESLLRNERVAVIYYPDAAEMYPTDFATRVSVERLSDLLCGPGRPGHFTGVTTVVAKLFNAVKPHVAVFGAKDAQQALIVRRMTADLDFDIEIVVAPTVREPDGLAMSSRNARLSPRHRAQAAVLYRALSRATELVREGERDADVIKAAITGVIGQTDGQIDYVEIVDSRRLLALNQVDRGALVALAVRFGNVRLIDNILIS
jgi:pantoate--beta-alanine ligase